MGEGGGTGRGGVEGRGENADNCNLIKMNKLIKKIQFIYCEGSWPRKTYPNNFY